MKPARYLGRQLEFFLLNYITAHVPVYCFRKAVYRLCGAKIGQRTIIDMDAYVLSPELLRIGSHTHINHDCMLNAEGGITIGDNVSISHHVRICSSSHAYDTPDFKLRQAPIRIDNHVWIGLGAMVHLGVLRRCARQGDRQTGNQRGGLRLHIIPPYTWVEKALSEITRQ